MIAAFLFFFVVSQSATTDKPNIGSGVPNGAHPVLTASEIVELQHKAEGGDSEAELSLARAFDKGSGVPQSDAQAAQWYRKAAGSGNVVAETALGTMYREGRGVEKDKEEAVRWYRKAARLGDALAMWNLGTAFYNGEGVQENAVSAFAWFLLAESAGAQYATEAVNRSEADLKGWGVRDGYLKVAAMYQTGDDLNHDPAQAVKWYRKGAERGFPEAQLSLAEMVIEGDGVPQNYAEARSWCETADKEKFPLAAYCLGQIYRRGLGVPKDTNVARKYYEKASMNGIGKAMLQLGEMYWTGDGVKLDKITAYSWMLLAFSCQTAEAGPEALRMQKGMSGREIDKGKQKALDFLNVRPLVRLRVPVPTATR